MILRRYSVCEEGFWEYTINDDVLQGSLEDWCFEDKNDALKKCKNLNLKQRKNSIYKQNQLIAKSFDIAEKIKISITLPDCTVFSFEINPTEKKFRKFISKGSNCEISEIKTNIDNKIEEIFIEEA